VYGLNPIEDLEVVDRPDDKGNAFLVSFFYDAPEATNTIFQVYVAEPLNLVYLWRLLGSTEFFRTEYLASQTPKDHTDVSQEPLEMVKKIWGFHPSAKIRHLKETYEDKYPKVFGWGEDTHLRHVILVDRYSKYGKNTMVELGKTYWIKVKVYNKKGESRFSERIVCVTTETGWFKTGYLWIFIFAILFAFNVLLFIKLARSGRRLFIRKIAGLEAVEEAVGRSTEMGKPLLFTHGFGHVGALNVIASLNILGKIAERVAEYRSILKVTNTDPIVMLVSQESVSGAYRNQGVPDLFHTESIYYISSDQFQYAAGVSGLLLRDRPGAVFYMGGFAAESLIIAETGVSVGAIQIAASDSFTQLPFFVTTCDYTLMGEELYAASAYLSAEPRLLGTIKAMDYAKLFVMIMIFVGNILGFFIDESMNVIKQLLTP